VAFVPDSNLILQVFPIDRRLPALPVLMSPELLAAELPHHHGVLTRARAEPVRYRAGIGCALRWHLEADSDGRETLYVKAYRDDQGAATHASLRTLGAAPGTDGFSVPRPVAYLGAQRALVQQGVSGTSLADILLAKEEAISVMAAAAEALARFHRETRAPGRRRTRSDQLESVRRAAALVSWVRPTLTEAVQSLVVAIGDRLPHAEEPAATHGDLKPDHIVLSDDRLALLDLDWFASGDPVMDAGAMVARVTGMALRHPAQTERLEAAGRTFADTYLGRVPSTWRKRFPPHLAAALLTEAAGTFRHQLPNWPELVEVAIRRAGDVLSG
jgi:hypothetical protein